jgi:chloramphenicol O-acetyltransferase
MVVYFQNSKINKMKNILIAVLILVANFCAAQVFVNQIDVNKFDYQYLEMWEHYNKQTGKFNALIDYGQNVQKSNNNESIRMNQQNGEPMTFNSIIAILNFLHKNGWELVTIKSTGEFDSFIMRRVPKTENAGNKESGTAESEDSTDSGDGNGEKNEEKKDD